MFTISKKFSFDSSHSLNLPTTHKCSNIHGHTYCAEFIFSRDSLDKDGFVIDFCKLDIVKDFINNELDHRHLNSVHWLEATTSEVIAKSLFDKFTIVFPQLCAVRISETPTTWAEYSSSVVRN